MIGRLVKKLIGVQGLTKEELRESAYRHRFSDYLPWVAYDPETKVYVNIDGTVGFLWECIPLVFASTREFETLSGLFKITTIPDFSVLQFMLFADPYIEPIVEWYSKLKVQNQENHSLVKEGVERIARFVMENNEGIKACQGIPLRNFRLFVSLKMPVASLRKSRVNLDDLRANVHEILQAIGLYPRELEPGELIFTMFRIFNNRINKNLAYDDTRPISSQIILAETPIEFFWNYAKIGDFYFKCLTPKQMPKEVGPLTMNVLTGDIWGVQSDGNQVPTPFILSVNVIYQNLKVKLHSKCNFVLQQKAVGSFAPSLVRKQSEYLWATAEIERGTTFVRVMPIVWVYAPNLDKVRDAAARVKRMWESEGFVMQEESAILKILFIAALPFGLYTSQGIIDTIDRDFICHDKAAAFVLPIQADCSVQCEPHVLFFGRKGQLISLDLFDQRSNNMNAFVAAESGSGKSFFVNHLVFNYYASGAIIRIVDIGGSYRKLVQMLGGKFISFSEDSKIIINPFGNVLKIEDDLGVLSAIVAQMAYSATGGFPDELEMTLIKSACLWAWKKKGKEATIDDVYEYLNSFPNLIDSDTEAEFQGFSSESLMEFVKKAKNLAFNLQDFTSRGIYGRWFCGPTTLDISKDDLVVLELEELKHKQELFRVITLQVLNYVTQDLYLSDRSRRRMIIFDEAWQFFKETNLLAQVIEEGYRRARKYGGSFVTITQSLLDFKSFGRVGEVIMGNSAWKFLLQSSDYERAHHEKIIDVGEFELKILKSVRNVRPKYSEIFVNGPVGKGVIRLVVDPYTYYVYTTDAQDVARLNAAYRETGSWEKAIQLVLQENTS